MVSGYTIQVDSLFNGFLQGKIKQPRIEFVLKGAVQHELELENVDTGALTGFCFPTVDTTFSFDSINFKNGDIVFLTVQLDDTYTVYGGTD